MGQIKKLKWTKEDSTCSHCWCLSPSWLKSWTDALVDEFVRRKARERDQLLKVRLLSGYQRDYSNFYNGHVMKHVGLYFVFYVVGGGVIRTPCTGSYTAGREAGPWSDSCIEFTNLSLLNISLIFQYF